MNGPDEIRRMRQILIHVDRTFTDLAISGVLRPGFYPLMAQIRDALERTKSPGALPGRAPPA